MSSAQSNGSSRGSAGANGSAVAPSSPIDMTWWFSQVKGAPEEEASEAADLISCVEWDSTGELLATGDKGGRVVVFRRDRDHAPPSADSGASSASPCEFSVYSTFQSHEPEFDYLKSLEIEEKINKIRWLPKANQLHNYLLSTNDKTVKLWKLTERDKRPEGSTLRDENAMDVTPSGDSGSLGSVHTHFSERQIHSARDLRLPRMVRVPLTVEASLRRIYANAHAYHINSIALSSDLSTFISADDLRINLWSIDISDTAFNTVDIKPANMEDLTEVITAAEFHPINPSQFIYASSKGAVRLCDLRVRALCDHPTKVFEEPEDPTNRSFFSEIITSISDVKFSHSGRYFLSRDYLTLKVWDMAMERAPVETYAVHEPLRAKLCTLYENDCIFDKFECAWAGDDRQIMTGSYNNFFRVFERESRRDATLEASRMQMTPGMHLQPRRIVAPGQLGQVGGAQTPQAPSSPATSKRSKGKSPLSSGAHASASHTVPMDVDAADSASGTVSISVDNLNYTKKILHLAWNPRENIAAIATTNNLYIFQSPSTPGLLAMSARPKSRLLPGMLSHALASGASLGSTYSPAHSSASPVPSHSGFASSSGPSPSPSPSPPATSFTSSASSSYQQQQQHSASPSHHAQVSSNHQVPSSSFTSAPASAPSQSSSLPTTALNGLTSSAMQRGVGDSVSVPLVNTA